MFTKMGWECILAWGIWLGPYSIILISHNSPSPSWNIDVLINVVRVYLIFMCSLIWLSRLHISPDNVAHSIQWWCYEMVHPCVLDYVYKIMTINNHRWPLFCVFPCASEKGVAYSSEYWGSLLERNCDAVFWHGCPSCVLQIWASAGSVLVLLSCLILPIDEGSCTRKFLLSSKVSIWLLSQRNKVSALSPFHSVMPILRQHGGHAIFSSHLKMLLSIFNQVLINHTPLPNSPFSSSSKSVVLCLLWMYLTHVTFKVTSAYMYMFIRPCICNQSADTFFQPFWSQTKLEIFKGFTSACILRMDKKKWYSLDYYL